MCGVAGMYRSDGRAADQPTVGRMLAALSHRGPDGEGLWSEGVVALGHRRLAIRDLSIAGHQPMMDDRGEICVSYNGEVYNYARLRREIERQSGYQFRSSCDTEVIPIGWRLWGEHLFERIEGMFAVALWDRRTQTLILARDNVGIKPMYIAHVRGVLLFASEIKGLLASGRVPADLDPGAIHTYMAAGYPARDTTLLQHVRQLSPGTIERWDASGCTRKQYWRPERTPAVRNIGEAADAVRACLLEVTSDMQIADVPVGLLLSSGVDSSLIALTARGDVPCYTATFDERTHDESLVAQTVAATAGSKWRPVQVNGLSETAADFAAIVRSVDGQLADSSCLAHFALCRAIRREVKVALSGDGADEFFGGYPTYVASRVARWAAPLMPRCLAQALGTALLDRAAEDESRLPWHEVASRFLLGLANARYGHHAEWRRITPAQMLPLVYGPAMRFLLDSDPLREYRGVAVEASGDLLDSCLLADQRVYLPADMLVKVDRCSMAHGLEIRVPFLDRRMMDLAGKLDGALLAPLLGPKKRVLRTVLGSMNGPQEVISQPKRGFNVPLARMLRRELRTVGADLIVRSADIYEPFFAPDALLKVWHEHIHGLANHAYMLWAVLVFGAWRRMLMDSTHECSV